MLFRSLGLLVAGTPYAITNVVAIQDLGRIFGVPGSRSDLLRLINPSWVWVYVPPALLFAVNLVLVWREKR